jgi:hypothetical protein
MDPAQARKRHDTAARHMQARTFMVARVPVRRKTPFQQIPETWHLVHAPFVAGTAKAFNTGSYLRHGKIVETNIS